MIRSLLQSLPRRQYIINNRSHMIKTQPHEVAESEEKEAHDWGKITKKDTSFEDTGAANEGNYWSEQLSSGEDYKKMNLNVEKDKWCS